MTNTTITKQAVIAKQTEINASQITERFALFNSSGEAIDFEAVPVGSEIVLTGYVAGTVDDVEATDTVNEAIAKVEAKADVIPTGADVILTGYTAGSASSVVATDTTNAAIAKLEARIAALEAA